MPKTLLAATTDAAASASETLDFFTAVPAVFRAPGLAGAEVATLQHQAADESWIDHYESGSLAQCTATNSAVAVYGPGIYRLNKGATAAAVSVEVSTWSNP